MNHETIISLGEYLNEQISMETCDTTLSHSEEWMRSAGIEDVETELEWLHSQGISCDCEVVTLLYLRIKEEGPDYVTE
jgi:Protein of unknown function (DUF2695)